MLWYCQYHTILKSLENYYILMDIQLLTRKSATCSDLLSCLYNLKPIDIEVLTAVAKKENSTLDQIAQAVERDRSSTHRCLAKLITAGLVNKESKGLKIGGYYHVYSMVEATRIKQHAIQKVKEITESLQTLVNNFDSDLKNSIEK